MAACGCSDEDQKTEMKMKGGAQIILRDVALSKSSNFLKEHGWPKLNHEIPI